MCGIGNNAAQSAMLIENILKQDKTALDNYTIEQIVAMCGDGKLRDGSKCADELRQFLSSRSAAGLAGDANYCLENKFEKSGVVLQDVVNEIGRRLGYAVKNGLYQGRSNAVGYDGIWNDGDNELLIEVKTTDAYRINLDTLFGYGEKLNAQADEVKSRFCLVVVGRQDTGDLEAQIRGSRYAWSVRMVSVEALIKLMFVNAEVEDQALTDKIRKVLLPFEYTRVDHIIDLVFETQKDAEPLQNEIASNDSTAATSGDDEGAKPAQYDFTPAADLDAKRDACVSAFYKQRSLRYVRKSKTNFIDEGGQIAVTCAISKRYDRPSQVYWYALHKAWLQFMQGSTDGYLLLGCMDANVAYAVPVSLVASLLEKLGTTKKKNGEYYWHILLAEDGDLVKWNLSKVGETIELSKYALQLV